LKLTIYGIRNEELVWFKNYLFNRTQFVAFEGVESSVQPISCGVHMGSILGIHLKRCMVLYADDTVIYCANRTCERIEKHLNNDLGQISNWFVRNNLVINLKCSKTECFL
jgi:hypothetical protein